MQRKVAELLHVNTWTILNWEKGRTEPPIGSIPAIVKFLDYDPFPVPITTSQLLVARRRETGLSIRDAAKAVGVDPGTWGNWERGQTILYRKHRALVAKFLGLPVGTLNREMTAQWNRSHKRAF